MTLVTIHWSKAVLSNCCERVFQKLRLTCYRLPALPAVAAPADGEASATPSDTPTFPATDSTATPTPADPSVDPVAPVADSPAPVVDTPAPVDTTAQTPSGEAAPVVVDPVAPAK